jgi:hypothetical protein
MRLGAHAYDPLRKLYPNLHDICNERTLLVLEACALNWHMVKWPTTTIIKENYG